MNRIRVFAVLALLVVAMAWGAGPAGAQSVGQQDVGALLQARPVAIPASLQDIYRRLAIAWESEDAREIAHLARKGRVYVVVQREGIGERLAATQLHYLLEELFEATEELQFRFPAYSAYDPEAGTGYAVGERVYNEGPGIERSDRVFVGARYEHGRWVLTELRLTFE